MLYTIKSGKIEFSAESFGAEMQSLKLEGYEYLWQGLEAWPRYAPILFPFICSPKDQAYRAGGKDYIMKENHGLARYVDFEFAGSGEDYLEFVLRDNEETLAQYPYNFELVIRYTALENGVRVDHTVRNTGDKTMYFYLGGHPAFKCPLTEGESFEDYEIVYDKNERIVDQGGNVLTEDGNTLAVKRSLFDYDSIQIGSQNSGAVTLKSRKSDRAVTVKYPQSKCITVWSVPGNDDAAFVCLEPWTDVPINYDDEYPDIENKPHAIALAAGETYTYYYDIEVR